MHRQPFLLQTFFTPQVLGGEILNGTFQLPGEDGYDKLFSSGLAFNECWKA